MARPPKDDLEVAESPKQILDLADAMGEVRVPCRDDKHANSVKVRLSSCRAREARKFERQGEGPKEMCPLHNLVIRKDGAEVIVKSEPMSFYLPED
jgi:hypothetical protein